LGALFYPEVTMLDYAKLNQMLIQHEGLRLRAYTCPAGKITVGVGRNLEDNGITTKEALYLLRNDIAICEADLAVSFPNWYDLSEVRQGVFIDMRFNLGRSGFWTFRKMRAAAKVADWHKVAKEMLDSKWARQISGRSIRLADAMITNKWPDNEGTWTWPGDEETEDAQS
jgi:lysozyme